MTTSSHSASDRESRVLIIWTVIFGVALALGGSVLEPLPIPYLNITAASPLVALLITLNKLVVMRRFSVTAMYTVVSIIAIFTTYLGPPSILKPIFIIAGLSFDAATLFRTTNLRFWNLVMGHAVVTVTGFACFWVVFSAHAPGSAAVVGKVLLLAAPVHFVISLLVAALVYRAMPPSNPPAYLLPIWDQLGVSRRR